jgi:hypothetical protein
MSTARSDSNVLFDPAIAKLRERINGAMRSTEGGVKYFIEPAAGALADATSKRHHIVFGRRGSGKTSLLRKAAAELTKNRTPIAFVDLETFKGHSYPDVLISVLIASFTEFRDWLQGVGVASARRKTLWNRFFGSRPTRPALNRKAVAVISGRISAVVADLEKELHAAEQTDVTTSSVVERSDRNSGGIGVGAGVSGLSVTAGLTEDASVSTKAGTERVFRTKKVDFLHRHIMDYQGIFRDIARISDSDAFLFLDDLYHIRRADQALVVDYFHRIAKGGNTRLWLKIGTIRHRTQWYVHADPPVGLKLGDDADDINLDISLERYQTARTFLLQILAGFSQEEGLSPGAYLTDGARDRLVLASGGVARDFLAIFRSSVDAARERVRSGGPAKVDVEDVNIAAGAHDSSKQDEFKRDAASEDQKLLYEQFVKVREFCLDDANCNCFLVHLDAKGPEMDAINELVDLKLLHLVRSRVTVSAKKGQLYQAFMLDLSQYAGARAKRGLDMVRFWLPDAQESLRRSKLIY